MKKENKEDKSEKIMLMTLLAVLIIAFAYVMYASFFQTVMPKTNSQTSQILDTNTAASTQALKTIDTGDTDPGSVEIALTPHKVKDGKMIVDIATNTHSVTMSQFDLTKIMTLEYNGKVMYPSSVPQMEGHHIRGTVVFDVENQPNKFTIKIINIPSIQERVFSW